MEPVIYNVFTLGLKKHNHEAIQHCKPFLSSLSLLQQQHIQYVHHHHHHHVCNMVVGSRVGTFYPEACCRAVSPEPLFRELLAVEEQQR